MEQYLKYLLRLPLHERNFWLALIEKIQKGKDLNSLDTRKLSGFKTLYRVRKGNMRLIYRVISEESEIIAFGPRGDIYRSLKDYQE